MAKEETPGVIHRSFRITSIAAELVPSALAQAPASAQAQKSAAMDTNAIPAAERKAKASCVSGVLNRLQQERTSYRAVKPAVGQECDAQLRAVLGAAIRSGQAGLCTSADGYIEAARGRAGDEASTEFQRVAVTR